MSREKTRDPAGQGEPRGGDEAASSSPTTPRIAPMQRSQQRRDVLERRGAGKGKKAQESLSARATNTHFPYAEGNP